MPHGPGREQRGAVVIWSPVQQAEGPPMRRPERQAGITEKQSGSRAEAAALHPGGRRVRRPGAGENVELGLAAGPAML